VFIAAVTPKLHRPEAQDLVALRVTVRGERDGRPAETTFELVDYFDEATGISAMMRTTGFSLSLTGQLQVEGRTGRGVLTPDEAMPFEAYVAGLVRHGVDVVSRES
jgi:lysine 6-dehydrogenase